MLVHHSFSALCSPCASCVAHILEVQIALSGGRHILVAFSGSRVLIDASINRLDAFSRVVCFSMLPFLDHLTFVMY